MGAIAYRNSGSEVISGNWSARSNSLSNPSLDACWIKTPFLTWSAGNVTLDAKLINNTGTTKFIAFRFIPYDANDTWYEGTPSAVEYQFDFQKVGNSFTTNVENISFPVPAQYQDGNSYKLMISFAGTGGNNRVGGSFYNTVAGEPLGISDTQRVSITFATPSTVAVLSSVTFNPFLIKDRTRGWEIHLRDYPPIALADQSVFGTVDDDSNPAQNRYYKSPENLPWALEVSSRFEYPTEKTDILDAYLDFANWAQSSGQQEADWYVEGQGRRSESNIY